MDGNRMRPCLRSRYGKAVPGMAPDNVLHVHGFARAQQAAVEYGVREHRPGAGFLRQLEAPGFDTVLPAGMNEAHVVPGLRGDENARPQPAQGTELAVIMGRQFELARGLVRLRRQLRIDARDPVRIGPAAPKNPARAVHDIDRRAGNRFGLVQGRHPHQRRLAPLLEVHGEVGD